MGWTECLNIIRIYKNRWKRFINWQTNWFINWWNTSVFFWSLLINSLVAGSSKMRELVEESALFLLTYFQNFFGHPRMLAIIDDSSDSQFTRRDWMARSQALLCAHYKLQFFPTYSVSIEMTWLISGALKSPRRGILKSPRTRIYFLNCLYLLLIASSTNFGCHLLFLVPSFV